MAQFGRVHDDKNTIMLKATLTIFRVEGHLFWMSALLGYSTQIVKLEPKVEVYSEKVEHLSVLLAMISRVCPWFDLWSEMRGERKAGIATATKQAMLAKEAAEHAR